MKMLEIRTGVPYAIRYNAQVYRGVVVSPGWTKDAYGKPVRTLAGRYLKVLLETPHGKKDAWVLAPAILCDFSAYVPPATPPPAVPIREQVRHLRAILDRALDHLDQTATQLTRYEPNSTTAIRTFIQYAQSVTRRGGLTAADQPAPPTLQ